MRRYDRNKETITNQEQKVLKNSRICVIGCGGLGGYIIEELGRIGVGYITVVDGDVFEESNLNRQIFCDMETLYKSKAETAQIRIKKINPEIFVNPIVARFDENNAESIIKDHDVIVDALDNIESKFLVQEKVEKFGIPFVHGAIAGWFGQISTVFPGDRTLDKIYSIKTGKGIETFAGNPAFIAAIVASLQVSEVIKLLLKKGELLKNKVLFLNLLNHEYNKIDL
jgi:molybdopterin/thiamine biosynthesis adenylyltransferase